MHATLCTYLLLWIISLVIHKFYEKINQVQLHKILPKRVENFYQSSSSATSNTFSDPQLPGMHWGVYIDTITFPRNQTPKTLESTKYDLLAVKDLGITSCVSKKAMITMYIYMLLSLPWSRRHLPRARATLARHTPFATRRACPWERMALGTCQYPGSAAPDPEHSPDTEALQLSCMLQIRLDFGF